MACDRSHLQPRRPHSVPAPATCAHRLGAAQAESAQPFSEPPSARWWGTTLTPPSAKIVVGGRRRPRVSRHSRRTPVARQRDWADHWIRPDRRACGHVDDARPVTRTTGRERPHRVRGGAVFRGAVRSRPASSRSYRCIDIANVLTLFNLSWRPSAPSRRCSGTRATPVPGVRHREPAIGIVQEVRAKRTVDRLSALVAPTATVIRGGPRPRGRSRTSSSVTP